MEDLDSLGASPVGFFNPMLGGGEAVSAFGGGGGGEGCFDMEGEKIVRCSLLFGREWLTCGDTTLAALSTTPAGVIYAEITHPSVGSGGSPAAPQLAVKQASTLPANSLEKSYRALYYARSSGGSPPSWSWADVRYMPVVFAMN